MGPGTPLLRSLVAWKKPPCAGDAVDRCAELNAEDPLPRVPYGNRDILAEAMVHGVRP